MREGWRPLPESPLTNDDALYFLRRQMQREDDSRQIEDIHLPE